MEKKTGPGKDVHLKLKKTGLGDRSGVGFSELGSPGLRSGFEICDLLQGGAVTSFA